MNSEKYRSLCIYSRRFEMLRFFFLILVINLFCNMELCLCWPSSFFNCSTVLKRNLFVFVMWSFLGLLYFFPYFRDIRNNKVALFDGIEEGGVRASALYPSSHEIDEHDNEQAVDGLHDRVNLLKRVRYYC